MVDMSAVATVQAYYSPFNNFNGSLRKLPSSMITVSIINLNTLVWNSSFFTIWPQLTFLTIFSVHPFRSLPD